MQYQNKRESDSDSESDMSEIEAIKNRPLVKPCLCRSQITCNCPNVY